MRGPVPSARMPLESSPKAKEVWQGRDCGHVRWPALGQTGQSQLRRFTNRKRSAGGGVPTVYQSTPPEAARRGLLSGDCTRPGQERGKLLQWVLGVGYCTIGGRGEKVSRLNKEPEGGDSRAPPRRRIPAPETPSLNAQPPSFPLTLPQSQLLKYPLCQTPQSERRRGPSG